MIEIWKDIDPKLLGIDDEFIFVYQVSTNGRVRRPYSIHTNKNQKYRYVGYNESNFTPGESRYTNIMLKITEMNPSGIRHKSVMRRVHRIVATHFIPNPDNKEQINHKDRNKHNNCFDNLEWCTSKENCQHRELTNKTEVK